MKNLVNLSVGLVLVSGIAFASSVKKHEKKASASQTATATATPTPTPSATKPATK